MLGRRFLQCDSQGDCEADEIVSWCFEFSWISLLIELDGSAIVWGASAKHARGQKVGLDHILEDEDGKLDPHHL